MKPSIELADASLSALGVALRGDDAHSHVAQEVAEVGAYLLRRVSREPAPRHVAYDGDEIAALRHGIDQRIATLGDEGQEDGVLALIADLIQYRIALWNAPVDFLPQAENVLADVRGSREGLAAADHVHDGEGRCVKNRSGVFCPEPESVFDGEAPAITVVVNL